MRTSLAWGVTALAVAGLALSGCGRRGALEPPPNGAAVTRDRAELAKPPPAYVPPDRPFVLDPLI